MNELTEIVSKLDFLHREFEILIPKLYEITDDDKALEIIKELYTLVSQGHELASKVYSEFSRIGGEAFELAKELYRMEHQMKYRLESLIALHSKGERFRFFQSIESLLQFNRIYDYTVEKTLKELALEAETLSLLSNEKKKKVPRGIVEKVAEIDELGGELRTLLTFLGRMYTSPSDVYRVEDALKEWHKAGLLWVEARNIEKSSGVRNVCEILEGLALIGVVDKSTRGGESVYRHRNFRKDSGNI